MFFLDCEGLGKRQIQPFADVLQNRWSSKFRKACNFIKKRLKHKLFPGEYCKIFKNVFNKIPLVAASEKSFREFSSHNHTCLKQRERKKLKQKFWILLKDFVPVCLQAPFNDRGVATGRGGGAGGHTPPSISEPNKVQLVQFQTSNMLLFTGVQNYTDQKFHCILQVLDNLRQFFIFSNYIGEIDHFTSEKVGWLTLELLNSFLL